ncbi:hypothetical protein JYT29_02665 [Nitrospina gracilis]|nr:hypothetical protein [Nitrospina gracilis]
MVIVNVTQYQTTVNIFLPNSEPNPFEKCAVKRKKPETLIDVGRNIFNYNGLAEIYGHPPRRNI